MANHGQQKSALVLGRAMHAPWNEGTRVIGRDLARAIQLLRPVTAVSLTGETFRGQPDDRLPVEHVYSRMSYGMLGDYAGLAAILRKTRNQRATNAVEVAHLIGLPLALAPWLRRRGMRVVAHVVLTRQMYMGRVEHLRAALAWRVFDRWIDAYACTSEQIRGDLLRQGYNPAKVQLIPPPLDVAIFRPIDRAAARRELGMPQDAFIVTYVGTVSPLRFPAPEIMRGLSQAATSIPGLRLEVFAPVATHGYNRQWAEENVRQAAGAVAVPVQIQLKDLAEVEKALVYSAADVVLLPFSAPVAVEPPLTLLEAMACETVVAVAPYANRSRIVTDGINGVLYASAEELAARLVQVAGSGTAGRRELGRAGRRSVVEQNSLTAVASAIRSLWTAIGLPAGKDRLIQTATGEQAADVNEMHAHIGR